MRTFWMAAMIGAMVLAGPAAVAADPGSRLRSSIPGFARLVAQGCRHSATIRHLVARLESSDVIVHVEPQAPVSGIDGGLQFVGATEHARYLRIAIRTDLPAAQLTALLGHELRHALEVADTPAIRDESSFRHFYEIHGIATRRGLRVTFDTRDAVEAGLRVALELRASLAAWTTTDGGGGVRR